MVYRPLGGESLADASNYGSVACSRPLGVEIEIAIGIAIAIGIGIAIEIFREKLDPDPDFDDHGPSG
jgi:hypothetical protein